MRMLKLQNIYLIDELIVLLDKAEELKLIKISGSGKGVFDRDDMGFKDLKYLEVDDCEDFEHLFGKLKQFTPSRGPYSSGSFSKLTKLVITDCQSMKYLLPLSCARALQQLEELSVQGCGVMEQIIGDETEADEEDQIINFCRLKSIELEELPEFVSFYPEMEETTIEKNDCSAARYIFNEKVSFPALEKLVIKGLPVKNIWNGQVLQSLEGSERVSFSQLKMVWVEYCSNMVNVLPSNMLLRLQNLEELIVYSCDSVTSLAEGLPVALKSNAMLPKLRSLDLVYLPKLIKTWSNDEEYCSLDISISPRLRCLIIKFCESLRYVFSPSAAKNIAQIETLTIGDCEGMEAIIPEMRSEELADDGMIKFCQLKLLALARMPNLKSFCKSTSEAPPLFNHQVSFPALEKLFIRGLLVKNIWNGQVLQSPEGSERVSFSQLKEVLVEDCSNMVNVLPSNMLLQLQNLEELDVSKCESMTSLVESLNSIVKSTIVTSKSIVLPNLRKLHLQTLPNLTKTWLNDKEYSSHDISVSPRLTTLEIEDCDSLRDVFSALVARNVAHIQELSVQKCSKMEVIVSKTSEEEIVHDGKIKFYQLNRLSLGHLPILRSFCQSNFEAPALFNHQVDFPMLETLFLCNIQSCNVFVLGEGGFRNLRFVKITECPRMRNLFTSSLALECLEILSVMSCEIMEEVVEENKLGKPKAASCIEFPKLKMLNLIDLGNLKSLCNNESYSFSFPSLRAVAVKGCPEMKALAYEKVPRKILAAVRDKWVCFEDLNAYFRGEVPEMKDVSKNKKDDQEDDLRVFYDHDEDRFKMIAEEESYTARNGKEYTLYSNWK